MSWRDIPIPEKIVCKIGSQTIGGFVTIGSEEMKSSYIL